VRWIVLPSDWQTAPESTYINEEDLDLQKWDVFVDESSQRRYIIDEKSGQRFFLVSPSKLKQSTFQQKWAQLVKNASEEASAKKQVSFNLDPTVARRSSSSGTSNDLMENFDHEPSNLRMRTVSQYSPDRIIDRNSRANAANLKNTLNTLRLPDHDPIRIIKQPGKMGHLIKSSNSDQSDKKKAEKLQSPKERERSAAKQLKKTLQQQLQLKAQQEAARRAFLNRKMPQMGSLWLHQQLLDLRRRKLMLRNRISHSINDQRNKNNENIDHNGKHWRSMTNLNDPSLDRNNASSLDRDRLLEMQIYGYNRFDPEKHKKEKAELDKQRYHYDDEWRAHATLQNMDSANGFGGGDSPFVRGVLTENFLRHKDYTPVQINSR
jgi:hypothetical protein